MRLLHPGDSRELVRLDVVLDNETFLLSDPVPREIAVTACRMFAEQATPLNGRRVVRALIVPVVP